MFCAFLKTMLPVNSVLNRIAQDMELCQQPRCQHGQSVGAYEERDHQQPHAVTDGIHEDDEQTEEAENGGGSGEFSKSLRVMWTSIWKTSRPSV